MDPTIKKIFHVLDDKIKIAHAKDCKRAVNLDEKFGGGSAEHNSFRGAGAVELPGAGLGVLNYPLYVELLAKHHPNIPIIIEHIDESDIPSEEIRRRYLKEDGSIIFREHNERACENIAYKEEPWVHIVNMRFFFVCLECLPIT